MSMFTRERVAGVLLLLLVAIVLVFYFTAGESIKDVIYRAKDDFENERLQQCMDHFSNSYFKSSMYTNEQLRNKAQELFNTVNSIEVQIINLEVKQETQTGWARISVKVFASYGNRKIMLLGHPLKPFEGEIFFEKEDEHWKIVRTKEFPF